VIQEQPHKPARAARQARPCRLTGSHRSLRLTAVESAAKVARAAIREWLSDVGLAGLEDTLTLVATELIANAVAASAQWALRSRPSVPPSLLLILDARDGRVLIEVWDVSELPPVAAGLPEQWGSETGRGLVIVGTLAEEWGWRPGAGMPGKCVWAIVG
jgi:anti-sigma regulatory factor (Ser/Thr protein kinase)